MSLGEIHINDTFLCTDILLELFQYFYVDELFYTFADTIYHFSSLLQQGNVKLYVRQMDGYFRKHILPHIEPKNVLSIRIPNMYQMAPISLSQFTNVGLLILHNVTKLNWPQNLPQNLKSLTIHVRSKHRSEVLKKALDLDNVQRLEFSSTFLHFTKSNEVLLKPSRIKHLIFKSQRSFIDYAFLSINIPNLQSLKSEKTYYPHGIESYFIRFSCLHTIDLICKYMDIDTMISFLENVAAYSLRQCRLINLSNSLSSDIAVILIS
ncbi:hypothetical protein I4U23_008446 [Adineta vaga]|nr:hypothetical protein I4U23_008446 [Adineta vaga]